MIDLEKSPRAPDSDVITNSVFAADGQNHLFNAKLLLPSESSQIAFAQEYPEGGANRPGVSIELYKATNPSHPIDMLNARLQMIQTCAEEMKEIIRQLQSATKVQTSEEAGLETFQFHAPQHVDMNADHLFNGFGAAPAQQQLWGLPNNAQTSPVGESSRNGYCHLREVARMPIQQSWRAKTLTSTARTGLIDRADTEQYSHQEMVASHHENRMSLGPFSYECATPTLLQASTSSATPDYGNAPGSGVGGSGGWDLPQQPWSSPTFAHPATVEERRVRVSTMASPGSEGGISNTSTSGRQGIQARDYLCDCGLKIKRKGDLDRHRQSLRHSKQKYECSCGKAYTRQDSLKRHRGKEEHRS